VSAKKFKQSLQNARIRTKKCLSLLKLKRETMKREFKVDITLAAEIAQFLEAILEAEFNEEFDSEEACTDTFLDQFMPNGFVPNTDLIAALLASGIITPMLEPESIICVGCSQTWCECE
jgi:hypothetical protein